MPDDIASQWKALNPQQRELAMSRMSPDQKTKLASAMGFMSKDQPYTPTTSTGQGKQSTFGKLADKAMTGVVNAAPTIGTIAGGMGGAIAGGVGAVGGAGAGAAAGEAFKEKVTGQKMSAGKVAGQAAMGAASEATGIGIAKGVGKALSMLPQAERAAQVLQMVKAKAGNVPVDLAESGKHLARAQELDAAGGNMPPVLKKLIARYTDPNKPPLTYAEARDFYSNITRLTRAETRAMKGEMKATVVKAAQAIKQDIGDAADQVGQASQYYAGIKEYAKAKSMAAAADRMKKWAVRTAVGAAGAGGLYEASKAFGIAPSFGK